MLSSVILRQRPKSKLQSLDLGRCRKITDDSIISISTYCTGLQSLNIEKCVHINDASLKAIAMNCIRLQSLCTDGIYNADRSNRSGRDNMY